MRPKDKKSHRRRHRSPSTSTSSWTDTEEDERTRRHHRHRHHRDSSRRVTPDKHQPTSGQGRRGEGPYRPTEGSRGPGSGRPTFTPNQARPFQPERPGRIPPNPQYWSTPQHGIPTPTGRYPNIHAPGINRLINRKCPRLDPPTYTPLFRKLWQPCLRLRHRFLRSPLNLTHLHSFVLFVYAIQHRTQTPKFNYKRN